MKLKRRFLGIIIGAIIVPVIVAVLTIHLIAPDVGSIIRASQWDIGAFFTNLDDGISLEEVKQMTSEFPKPFYTLVTDDQNTVVYRYDPGNSLSDGSSDTNQQMITSKRVLFADETYYTVVVGSGFLVSYKGYFNALMMGSIILFISIISYMTIRALSRSLQKLEDGTKRMAEGDLDTPILLYNDDTFIELADSMNTMRKKVKEEYDRRTRFFTGVSHDLKTPLSSIMGYSQALLDGLAEDPETRDKYLKIINAKGQILDRRIAQLIQYIKLTNHDFRSNLSFQMFVPFLEDFAAVQADEAALLGTQFISEINIDRTTVVSFDTDLITRAMENLMQNCYRYGITDRPVRMICQYRDDSIQLAFINRHEKPISRNVIKHMFEPFYRGDASRQGEGFGLGLASVKSIMESHGWDIEVQSIESEGITVFQILIPRDGEAQKALPVK